MSVYTRRLIVIASVGDEIIRFSSAPHGRLKIFRVFKTPVVRI